MKNSITQFSLVIIAFVALSLLMSYTRPAANGPKEYIILSARWTKNGEDLEKEVNQKLAEGWSPQGGMTPLGGLITQTMVR